MASEDPTPGGGSAAALTIAFSAALSAMVARASPDWAERGSAVAQSEVIRQRVAPLAQIDAEAYEQALTAMSLPKILEPEVGSAVIKVALERAAEAPLLIAEAGADAACLAAEVADRGIANRRGDAVAAALLAEGATKSAARLVEINLVVTPEDERVALSRRLAATASEAASRAAQTLES